MCCAVAVIPPPNQVSPDTPLRLGIAAAIAFPDGSMTADALLTQGHASWRDFHSGKAFPFFGKVFLFSPYVPMLRDPMTDLTPAQQEGRTYERTLLRLSAAGK